MNTNSKTARRNSKKPAEQGTKPGAPVTVKEGSYLSRQVDRAYRLGEIDCDNMRHFVVTTDVVDGQRLSRIIRKSRVKILDMMMPGVTAKCACEMAACKESWTKQSSYGIPTSEYVPYGHYHKGVGLSAKIAPHRQVVVPRYVLNTAQLDILNHDFPQYFFVSPTGGVLHDHPISHTRAQMARYALLDSLPRGTVDNPRRYLDLHGNPGANMKYNSQQKGIVIETLVELVTPKDYLRRAHWPDRFQDGIERYYECSIAQLALRHDLAGRWAGFLGFHTGYYYGANDFASLFELCPRAKVMLTMHRFPTVEGTLSNGEQTWKKVEKEGVTVVEQFNVQGSGKYMHPDNAAWFEHSSAVINAEMAYTWDASLACTETYCFTVVAVPTPVALRDASCVRAPHAPTPSSRKFAMVPTDVFVANGFITYKANSKVNSEAIVAGEAKFFDEMRLNICGKERSPDRLRDHIAKAKTLVQGVQKKYNLPVNRTMELALAAFYVDLEHDCSVLPALMGEMGPQAKRMERLYAGEIEKVGFFDKVELAIQGLCDKPLLRDSKRKGAFVEGKGAAAGAAPTFKVQLSNDLSKNHSTSSRASVAALMMNDSCDVATAVLDAFPVSLAKRP